MGFIRNGFYQDHICLSRIVVGFAMALSAGRLQFLQISQCGDPGGSKALRSVLGEAGLVLACARVLPATLTLCQTLRGFGCEAMRGVFKGRSQVDLNILGTSA